MIDLITHLAGQRQEAGLSTNAVTAHVGRLLRILGVEVSGIMDAHRLS